MHFLLKLVRLVSGLFFAVTCLAGFIALMVLNVALLQQYFPWFVNKGWFIFPILISCPIPVIVCYGWYNIFNWIDRKLTKSSSGNTESEESQPSITKTFTTFLALIILLGLLVSLLFPAVGIGIETGPKVQAKNDVTQLVVAAKAYVTEYGKPPEGSQLAQLKALEGDNPRKIVFIEVDPKRTTKDGIFLDPWGTPYVYELSKPSGTWAYSFGRNKIDEHGNGDDCASWQ